MNSYHSAQTIYTNPYLYSYMHNADYHIKILNPISMYLAWMAISQISDINHVIRMFQ